MAKREETKNERLGGRKALLNGVVIAGPTRSGGAHHPES